MDHGENKHATETKWSFRYHYRDNSCCGVQDNPNHVELRVKPRGYPRLDFELPRQQYELDRIDQMMEQAYETGRRDNRIEIGLLLKDLISI